MIQDVQCLTIDGLPADGFSKQADLYGPAAPAERPDDGYASAAPETVSGDRQPAAALTQVAFVGPLSEPTFAVQLNGALRRLARAGHDVADIKFVSDGRLHSALVLYHAWQEKTAGHPTAES